MLSQFYWMVFVVGDRISDYVLPVLVPGVL
jgi:hypothetical protein